jgi:sarcosine oxidase
LAEVAVVGAGVNGLATAWALRRRGVDAVVYEQFELGHTRGSSHGRTRIFRLAYPEVKWVRLAQDAFEGWRELERESGE